jgi:hypothetical protein
MSDKPANYGRKWQAVDYDRLKELASIKPAMTPKEIGAAMDRTANSINCKLHRMDATHGVLRRGRPAGDKRKWRPCMRARGRSCRRDSTTGCAPPAAAVPRHSMRPGMSDADRKALIIAVSDGLFGRGGLPRLAYYMFVSPSTLRRWLSPSGSPPPDISERLRAAVDNLATGWRSMTDAARVQIDNHEMMDGASPALAEALKGILEDTA